MFQGVDLNAKCKPENLDQPCLWPPQIFEGKGAQKSLVTSQCNWDAAAVRGQVTSQTICTFNIGVSSTNGFLLSWWMRLQYVRRRIRSYSQTLAQEINSPLSCVCLHENPSSNFDFCSWEERKKSNKNPRAFSLLASISLEWRKKIPTEKLLFSFFLLFHLPWGEVQQEIEAVGRATSDGINFFKLNSTAESVCVCAVIEIFLLHT